MRWGVSDLCRPPVVSTVEFSVMEHGLQRDQPPAIGNISSIMIVIQKSDNAEGILEFLPDYVNITGQSLSL